MGTKVFIFCFKLKKYQVSALSIKSWSGIQETKDKDYIYVDKTDHYPENQFNSCVFYPSFN
jgi:hypothetical protein